MALSLSSGVTARVWPTTLSGLPSCTGGFVPCMASRGSYVTGYSSYSTLILRSARFAATSSSATTAAMLSP